MNNDITKAEMKIRITLQQHLYPLCVFFSLLFVFCLIENGVGKIATTIDFSHENLQPRLPKRFLNVFWIGLEIMLMKASTRTYLIRRYWPCQ